MYKAIFAVVVAVLVLSVWEHQKKPLVTPEQVKIRDAIVLAAASAPMGISGVFEMPVLAGGKSAKFVYLNSEMDYRDQRNLTISIPMALALEFKDEHGVFPDEYFKFKQIAVRGEAKRNRISFFQME